jgi:5-methyltetrahydrofolate--homocysteine methyltransferase
MNMTLQGTGKPISIDPGGPVCIIGERINPSGRVRLRQALEGGEWDFITHEAVMQVEAGAEIIDVNVGGKGIDEAVVLPDAVKRVSEAVEVPLSIDTRAPAALEGALKVCPGRPLINSIGGEDKILVENLPIIAEFGVPVIALCMGQEGVPDNVDERLTIAHYVLEMAVKAGIAETDVVFDPLVLTVGADDQSARVALETIRRLREEFPKNNITGGASNISFGMPARVFINAHFLSVAFTLGMNMPITDPTIRDIRIALLAGDIFLGHDRNTRAYMLYYRKIRQSRSS